MSDARSTPETLRHIAGMMRGHGFDNEPAILEHAANRIEECDRLMRQVHAVRKLHERCGDDGVVRGREILKALEEA